MRGSPLFVLLLASSLVGGCRVHRTLKMTSPCVEVPERYAYSEEEGGATYCHWWTEFQSPELNDLVTKALYNNLSIKELWWKVVQACAQVKLQHSALYPEVITEPSFFHFRSSGGNTFGTGLSGIGLGAGAGDGTGTATTAAGAATDPITLYLLSNSLSYEVDLWKKIDSNIKAACLNMQATKEDLKAAALTLTGTVTDLWLTIQEQNTLLDVIDHQIEVSKTQLELVELRFAVGESSALEVYQQRLQLSQTIAERPPILSLLTTSLNQMEVLLGEVPEKKDDSHTVHLVDLPPLPSLGSPGDLLYNRPDLKAELDRVRAADYQVAAAIADLFPRLEISISYDFRATKIKDLFDDKISQIFSRLVTPIIDGGRRRAEVQRTKAILCELINGYGQRFLDALLEVENALVQEKQQLELIKYLDHSLELANRNLEESQWHYINGLNDYLTVIAAIQSAQELERRLVSEKKKLLSIRTKLYLALGY